MTTKEAIEKFYEEMIKTIEGAQEQRFSKNEFIRALENGCEQIKDELIAEL